MSVSNTITSQGTLANGAIVGSTDTVTSGSNIFISESIPASQTNLLVAFAFTNAKLKSFIIHATAAMTVKTNSSTIQQETFTLLADKAYVWSLTGSSIGAAASPLLGDVTALYVTNTTAGVLTVSAIVDPT